MFLFFGCLLGLNHCHSIFECIYEFRDRAGTHGTLSFLLKCIELMGDGCLSNEHFEELGGILKGKLEEHFKNQELRQGECLNFP